MKAEEMFIKCGNEYNATQVMPEEVAAILTDPDLAFMFKAMREYAKDQIEKDRLRIKEQLYTEEWQYVDQAPIILD